MVVLVVGVVDGDCDSDRNGVGINWFIFVCVGGYNAFEHGGAETHRDVDGTDNELLIFDLYEGVWYGLYFGSNVGDGDNNWCFFRVLINGIFILDACVWVDDDINDGVAVGVDVEDENIFHFVNDRKLRSK